MTAVPLGEAVLVGIGTAVVVVVLAYGLRVLIRRSEMRRMAAQWKAAAATWDGKVVVLPSGCTCCPVHGRSETAPCDSEQSAEQALSRSGEDTPDGRT